MLGNYRKKFQKRPDKNGNCCENAEDFPLHPLFLTLFFFFFTSSVHDICLFFSLGRNPWQFSHYIYKHSYCIWHHIHHVPSLLSCSLFYCYLLVFSGHRGPLMWAKDSWHTAHSKRINAARYRKKIRIIKTTAKLLEKNVNNLLESEDVLKVIQSHYLCHLNGYNNFPLKCIKN